MAFKLPPNHSLDEGHPRETYKISALLVKEELLVAVLSRKVPLGIVRDKGYRSWALAIIEIGNKI